MKCPDCDGLVHGQHQAHQFTDTPVKRPATASHKPVLVANARQKVANKVANADVVANKMVANRTGDRHKDKAARRAYMRDYMAQRRHA